MFRGEQPLDHHGEFYSLSLLPEAWMPHPHPYGEINIDVAAVNPWMCRMAAAVANGIHVHPLHSASYLGDRLLPAVAEGAAASGRSPDKIDLIVPVFAVPARLGDSDARVEYARRQIAFYGSTRNYAFQFDDVGFPGTSARLNKLLKAGDDDAMAAVVTDEMLARFAVVAPWDALADALVERYGGIAARLVLYLPDDSLDDPALLERWGEVARAVSRE